MTARRRSKKDYLKSILLVSILILVHLIAQTLPHLQRTLDNERQQSGLPFLFSSSTSRKTASCLTHPPLHARTDHIATDRLPSSTLLQQPTPAACGTLRRRSFWQRQPLSSLSVLAQEQHAAQTNCSRPMANFYMDNQFGLGSHLYLWSQAICNADEDNRRIRTVNDEWLWRDQRHCGAMETTNNRSSTLSCYFGALVEPSCPDNIPVANVSNPRKYRCTRLQTASNDTVNTYRAASMELLFSNVSDLVLQEAERQAGLLFPGGIPPKDLIAVHLRWGDKFWEMDLAGISEYVAAISELLHQWTRQNETADIYLATEDPRAVTEFKEQVPMGWTVYVDRGVTELQSFRPHRGNRASWLTRNTQGRAGLVALGSLLVALEANAFVLTTQSNWSRLLDSLRRNVVDRRCGNCTQAIDLRPGVW